MPYKPLSYLVEHSDRACRKKMHEEVAAGRAKGLPRKAKKAKARKSAKAAVPVAPPAARAPPRALVPKLPVTEVPGYAGYDPALVRISTTPRSARAATCIVGVEYVSSGHGSNSQSYADHRS